MFGTSRSVSRATAALCTPDQTPVRRRNVRDVCKRCLPEAHEQVVVSHSKLDRSMLQQGAWAASLTAVIGLIMYTYRSNLISDAELHALGLSTLAGAPIHSG